MKTIDNDRFLCYAFIELNTGVLHESDAETVFPNPATIRSEPDTDNTGVGTL